MREKASFKVGVVAVAVLIVAATFLVPNPEGLAFEGKMLIGLLAAAIVLWVTPDRTDRTDETDVP